MSLTKKECEYLVSMIEYLHTFIEDDAGYDLLSGDGCGYDEEGCMINKYGEKLNKEGYTKEECGENFEPWEPSMISASSRIIHSKIFKKLKNRAEKKEKETDNRSREEKLEDPNYILCKRCDLILAKKHIRRHERTPRCLEIYKKKIASKQAQSTIVDQKDLINLDKKDKDEILENYYEQDEEMLKLIEVETKRVAQQGEK